MSTKLTGYVWDGCAASGMKLSSVAIMARLADFSNDEGVCWPSIETIARQIGAGMSTVRTAIARLEAEGWLTRKARRQGTEDLGKVTFRPSITAYVVGDDCFDQRDRLIDALNKPGPGTLVHPTYGELKVCVDGEVRVSTSKSEGRIVRFDLKFVEAGELSYPTSGVAYQ